MQLASIGSGSKGNGTLLRTRSTCVLIDCGFSLKETERRLATRGLSGEDLTAILVTHEHGDHIGGVGVLSRRFKLPVYMSHGTHLSGRCEDVYKRVCFDAGDAFRINDLNIQSVLVPHDARQPCQYVVEHQGLKVGILTDLGSVTPHVVECYGGCDHLLLEFNHDLELLRVGPYPPALKRRVGGGLGHLNNQQAADLLKQVDHEGLRSVLIAHISEQNNSREHIEAALRTHLGEAFSKYRYMSQSDGYQWVQLEPTTGSPQHQRAAGA
jgi:phosphoribosyl 1,2-cyclic phosphodiesterase